MYAIGIDISAFNTQISNCKVGQYDIDYLNRIIACITELLTSFEASLSVADFENELLNELLSFNSRYFPSPSFARSVYSKTINEKEYGAEKAHEFLPVFEKLADKFCISLTVSEKSFIDKWYFETVRNEIYFVNDLINKVDKLEIKSILQIILSRTLRSCRATTHSDLATLIEPVYNTYYCSKHKKICKPLFSILKWWKTYANDTVKRLKQFDGLRTHTVQHCFDRDSSTVDLEVEIASFGGELAKQYQKNKIKGIFCSPPYVGLIDYHEQHAYAYELFGLERKDNLEIDSLSKGSSLSAQEEYIKGISNVLLNCKKYLAEDYNVFIVANDKNSIYPKIAERSGMMIVEQFRRPVLNRTEKDKQAYSETIFRMKEMNHDIQ